MEKGKITRKELYALVWSTALTTLSKRFGISESKLRTICKKATIPLPGQGYRMRLQYNKQVEIPGLPEVTLEQEEILLKDMPSEATGSARINQIIEDIEKSCKEYLEVRTRIANPDIMIKHSLPLLKGLKPEGWGRDKGYLHPWSFKLPIFVTKKNLSRSLRLLDTFVKLVKARGHTIKLGASVGHVHIGNQEYDFNIREKRRRSGKAKNGYDYEYEPSGILTIYAGESYDKKSFIDGRIPLEKQLSRILAHLEYRHEYIKKIWAENDALRKIQEEKERIILEARRKEQEEKDKFRKLLRDAFRWHQVKLVREYLNEVDAYTRGNNDDPKSLQEWLKWARRGIETYDPLNNFTKMV